MPEEGEARERWIEKSTVLFDLILQSVNKEMFEHIKDLVEADDSGDDVKLVLDKIKDTYARMAAAGSSVSQLHRPEGWAPPGMKPPSGERAQGGAVQGSGAQGEGAQGNTYPGMFLMVEDVHGHEGDVGSVGKSPFPLRQPLFLDNCG
ncbi:hypothetical protein CLOP_g20103 [Closterium sp. NIES-67]|nr:hypothetical protein CLOP_g20103 [Closterium sp. NIES-67]